MNAPQPPHPPYDRRTQEALERVSRAVWAALLRLDAHEQRAKERAKAEQAAPPDPSPGEQHPLEIKDPTDGDAEEG